MNCFENAKKSVEEAARSLREKSYQSTLVERYLLLDEAWKTVKDLPQPLQLGKGLTYVLNKASLPIQPYDLLLGRFDDHVPTSEEQAAIDKILEEAPGPNANPIVACNGGHVTIDTETLVKIGVVGYIEKASQKIEELKKQNAKADAIVYLEGIKCTFEAIRDYIERYGKAAEAENLTDCASVCASLAKNAPKTFREALQLILIVYNVYLIYAGATVACLTVGRLDVLLLPFYLKDLEDGVLTKDLAGCLIDDFSAKMSLHLGRGEHQMAGLTEGYLHTGWIRNPVYESPGYIVIGGYRNDSDSVMNPLTRVFVEHIHAELKNPIYICRYCKDCDEALWDLLCKKIQENASLLLYNDDTVVPAHLHIGVEKKDAVNYSIHPCNWADIAGGSSIVGCCGGVLPIYINDVLHSSCPLNSMDDIYAAVTEAFSNSLRQTIPGYRSARTSDADSSYARLSLSDCLTEEWIENVGKKAKDRIKYPAIYVLLRSIGTAADMLSAIDWLVFQKKLYTLKELVDAADHDFENHLDILSACKKAPKYGTNHDFADSHAVRLMTDLLDAVDREATNEDGKRDVYTLNVTINDSNHIGDGYYLNATVDGRRRGVPLTENLSPTVGCAESVTDLLNSASKLPFDRIHSGALNVRLSRSLLRGENGVKTIKALIKSYFEQGGMQLQFTIADTEELRKAQADPDSYRDLLVRITGYSAVFVDMSKGAQEQFISRDELN